MVRHALAVCAVFFFASAAAAQNCDLANGTGNPYTTTCTTPFSTQTTCTVKITNLGAAACSGTWEAAIGAFDAASIVGSHSDVGACSPASNVPLPTPIGGFTNIPTAVDCVGTTTLLGGQSINFTADIKPAPTVTGPFFRAAYSASFHSSSTLGTFLSTSYGGFPPLVIQNCTATPSAPGASASGVPYFILWNPTATGGPYEIQEATSPDFSNASTVTETNTIHDFQHTLGTSAATFYYRVRPVSCAGSPGVFGPSTQVVVLPALPPTSHDFDIVVPIGTTSVSQSINFSGLTPGAAFTASSDEPFLTVSPASGNVRTDGTVNVTATATSNTNTPIGANTATVSIKLPNGKLGLAPNDSRSTSTTVTISYAVAVATNPKTTPPNDALIVPAVAHLEGAATFRSDVRITNTGSTAAQYQLTFTPQNTDGTTTGKQINISIGPGQTVALNDILKDAFGFAQPSDQAGGVLDIRVIAGGSAATTFVSSRTFAATPNGTYGQFVPAVPISKFLKNGAGALTLTQVSQSSKFRTNIGLVEGLGFPASVRIRVFNAIGTLLGEFPLTGSDALKPFEFRQLSQFLASKNLTNVPDARVEVVNDSPGAGVTTYASVLDQVTQDPLLVSPIQQASLSANRYVLPGMADFANAGASNFHSDVRIYNGSASTVNATATFYPQGSGTPIAQNISIASGEIKTYDNVLPTLFNTSGGGAIVVTTSTNVPLIVSGRTYSNAGATGTYGQFIPAVTPADGVGNGESALQVLQLEQSANFRSNLGLNELTGNPVTVRVTLIPAGSKTAAVLPDITLSPNEFRQLNSVFGQAYAGQNVYNGRATIQVVGGAGRVTAYGSVVDALTSDPTYVPAQK